MLVGIELLTKRLLLAGDCLLVGFDEGPLSRKLTLKLDASAAIGDPQETLGRNVINATKAELIVCQTQTINQSVTDGYVYEGDRTLYAL